MQITQPNSNINLSIDNIGIIDENNDITMGNNDGNLNPGEIVYLSLPVTNYGSNVEDNLMGILTSNSEFVNIIYGVGQYNNVFPGELVYSNNNYVIEVASHATDNDDLNQNDLNNVLKKLYENNYIIICKICIINIVNIYFNNIYYFVIDLSI